MEELENHIIQPDEWREIWELAHHVMYSDGSTFETSRQLAEKISGVMCRSENIPRVGCMVDGTLYWNQID